MDRVLPMNLGFFCTFFPDSLPPFRGTKGYGYGGADESLLDLVVELHKLGHNITIFSIGKEPDIVREIPFDGLTLYRYPILNFPFPKRTTPPIKAYFSPSFLQIPQTLTFDILHLKLGNSPAEFSALNYKKRTNTPLIMDIGGKQNPHWGGLARRSYMNLYLHMAYPRILQAADIILLRSQAYLADDQNLLNYKDKIRIVPQGVNYEFFKQKDPYPLPTLPPGRDNGGIKNILYVGNLVESKGVHILIQSLALAQREHPDLHLCIAGSGQMRPTLENLVTQLGLDNHVTFAGYVDKHTLRALYQWSNLFILPSLSEGFPRVLLEAMASGTPCLASDIGANLGALDNGAVGFTAKCFNINDFTEKINSFFDHDQHWFRQESTKARRHAQKFTWRKTAREVEKIYKELGGQR
jgi:1,4-alpha-glucan branching enzyme